jgi:histidinol-phosphatase
MGNMTDSSMENLADELALALLLADAADAVTLPRYRAADLDVRWKADRTHVTEADLAAEQTIRTLLATHRPTHAVLGEEAGLMGNADSQWRWVIDPIDGTANFVRGIPVWGTLIALLHLGEPVVGVVSAPAMARRWWAARGLGAHSDSGPLTVSQVATLTEAQVCTTGHLAWREHGVELLDLEAVAWRARGFGDLWAHMLVAEGAADVAVDAPGVTLWDLAAVQVVVEEAGGRFTDINGARTANSGTAVSSNDLVHTAALDVLHRRLEPGTSR